MSLLGAKKSRSLVGFTLLLATAIVLAGAAPASAMPVRSFVTKLTQPNGETFKARPYGDEWSNGYETLGGRTVVQNPNSGAWEYARRRQGKLVSSGLEVGADSPKGIPLHLRESLQGGSQLARGAAAHRSSALDSPNLGAQKAIVLLARFTNVAPTTTADQWATGFFGPSNSARDYFDEVSYGEFDLAPAEETNGTANDGVVGWLNIGPTHPNTDGNIDSRNRDITHDAIVASNATVDYASFDANSDGFISASELHITVIVAGHETSYGGPGASCGNSVWGHNWWLIGEEIVAADGVQIGDFFQGGGYNQFGERHCEDTNPADEHMATIGIMVHEMGHDLGLPDLYDTDVSSEGIGQWSVMASGSWTQASPTDYAGSSPTHMDAWSKIYEGWLTPQQIVGSQAGVELTQASASADVVQLRDNPFGVDWTFEQFSGTGEYFLIENRQLDGYDAGLPGCGLLIWHIDETRTSSNSANANENRKLVDLEEADGQNHLDTNRDEGGNRGDAGDPYLGPKVFHNSSNPNSRLYGGASSGVNVTNVSSACAPTMMADVQSLSHNLDVGITGAGVGNVESDLPGISCTPDCSQSYSQNTLVTLTATPGSDSGFTGWSGDCSGTGDCLVTMDEAKSVTANFNIVYDLNVTKSGTGTGTVTGANIDCGGDCAETYGAGTVVTLSADASETSKFVGWSGACSGSETCVVTMNADTTVDANFIGRTTTRLTVGKNANKLKATGSVKPNHPGSQVTVTLFKKRANGTWRKVATKRPSLNETSNYKATFTRLDSRRCKIRTRFAADSDHLGSSVAKEFSC